MTATIENTEKTSFTEIYAIYFPRMLRFARTYIIDKEDAENIVQDIFIYLWENRALLDGMHCPQAFLFTLVKRRSIDFIRKKLQIAHTEGGMEEIENHEYQFKLYSLTAFDEAQFSDEEIERLVRQAIDRLPERCRRIFIESKLNKRIIIFDIPSCQLKKLEPIGGINFSYLDCYCATPINSANG